MKVLRGFLRPSRVLILLLIAVALLFCAADSQSALMNEMIGIESLLKRVELRVSKAQTFSFQDRDIRIVLERMTKLSRNLELASARGPSQGITQVSTRYLTALGELNILYARAAHLPGVNSASFDYQSLDRYDLKLHDEAARPLISQKPFNARHADGDLIEFFVTPEEREMAEFLALSQDASRVSADGEADYEKLLQFVSVRQQYVNLWALQRLSTSTIPTSPVASCAPSLLSFRVHDGDLKSADAYLGLVSLDRYNSLTNRLDSAYSVTRDFSLASADDYYAVISRLFAPTPQFQAYTNGIDPLKVSQWLKGAAGQVAQTEARDWQSDPDNSKKILDSSTLISDDLSSRATASRMALAVAERHEQSAAAEIERIATSNIKIPGTRSLTARIESALRPYVNSSANRLAPKLLPQLSELDSAASSDQLVAQRLNAKIEELTPIASQLMPAVHDREMIVMGGGAITDSREQAEESQFSKTPMVYVRDQYRFAIADTTTFKNYFLEEIQKNASLWKKIQTDSDAKKALNQYFESLDQDMASRGSSHSPQQLLQRAKSEAQATLDCLSPRLQQIFSAALNSIQLLQAQTPMDLAPTTPAQRDLVELAISQGYEKEPLLGVQWKRPGWFQESETLLERLEQEAWSSGSGLDPQATRRLVLEALQYASAGQRGKLEDFCQADLSNPQDPRFKNMFLSSTHLRKILTSDPSDPKLAAQFRKFDGELAEKTESRSQVILDKYVDPVLTVVFVATLVLMAVSLFAPVGLAGAMTVLMAVLNYGVMAPLTGADLYLRTSVNFFEMPPQLQYQDAIASSQISAQDPYGDWEAMKAKGWVSETTDRATVDENRDALSRSQLMTIAAVPMDAWYGQSIYSGIRSSTGITGMQKVQTLFGGQAPAFVQVAGRVQARPFMEVLRSEGASAAIKEKAAATLHNAKQNFKAIAGLEQVYGTFTSEELSQALRGALARKIGDADNLQGVLSGVDQYVDFLKARLTASKAISQAVADDSPIPVIEAVDEVPRGMPLNQSPSLKGRLSWSEAMANPDLRKFVLIPKSAFTALRQGRIGEWLSNYGSVTEKINQLRGQLIATKIADFETLEQKLTSGIATGDDLGTVMSSLTNRELTLLEEAARGPQWLTYGYWSARLARMSSQRSSPLESLISIFSEYQEVLRSLRPIDWSPGYAAVAAGTRSEEDLRRFYASARSEDGLLKLGSENSPMLVDLENQIESELFPPANENRF